MGILWINIIIAILLAILLGNGSVVLVNKMPQKWFEDSKIENGEEIKYIPEKLLEADHAGRQRLTSTPWKYIFVSMLMVMGIYLSVTSSIKYEIPAIIILFIMLEIAICDQLYRVVPTQLFYLLLLTALGLLSYNDKWWEPLAGAGIGLAIGLAELGIGLLIYKKPAIGGADIMFFICMGGIAGRRGILVIFVLTTFLFAIESIYMVAVKKASIKEGLALMPSAFVATTIYLLFLYNILDIIEL